MALVHEQFERHAAATPGATALRFGDARLSYAELNVKANQLARFLAERGVTREDRVVVCVEPGFEIAIALLAILKAGAVYVPIDPSYPAARIQVMLQDTAPALLLTHSDLAGKLGRERVAPNANVGREDAERGTCVVGGGTWDARCGGRDAGRAYLAQAMWIALSGQSDVSLGLAWLFHCARSGAPPPGLGPGAEAPGACLLARAGSLDPAHPSKRVDGQACRFRTPERSPCCASTPSSWRS